MSAVLLVEGPSDVDFFSALLKQALPHRSVDIKPPRDFGSKNTVTVFPRLLDTLLPQLETGQLQQLGIVADADHTSGGGFASRWQTLTQKLADRGYRIPRTSPTLAGDGSVFRHPDGLPDVGMWLMPDHQRNGMLEDLILESVAADDTQQQLLKHACDVVAKLPRPLLFNEPQQCKARVYTWLAWQKRPGQGLDVALGGGLLDVNAPLIKGLCRWLQRTFPPPTERRRA